MQNAKGIWIGFFAILTLISASALADAPASSVPTAAPVPVAELAATCPDASLGETAADCPWADVARAISALPAEDQGNPFTVYKMIPQAIRTQLRKDAKNDGLKSLWGRSINFDELAHGEIVNPAILDVLHKAFRVPARQGRIFHAGTEHTYGYLFSNLRTAYGYKRARWVIPEIEAGFALPTGTISPIPHEGTLFANVAALAGKIAFRNDPAALKVLHRSWGGAAQAVRDFSIADLPIRRLEETVRFADSGRTVVLRTDIVPFTHVPTAHADGTPFTGDAAVLIYSVLDSEEQTAQLISMFPVAASFGATVFAPANLGDAKPIITRYNAYVEGVYNSATPLTGLRQEVNPAQP